MKNLQEKKTEVFNIFSKLYLTTHKFKLAFSGGKDSHCLLGLYREWQHLTKNSLDLEVAFADTRLETKSLYNIIELTKNFCEENGIKFSTNMSKKSFWYYQFGLGYPLPNWKNRWCTKYLKVKPLDSKDNRINMTGRHTGESISRDRKLKESSCSSGECGIDLISKSVDPIKEFTNCDVWDYLLEADLNNYLYHNSFDILQDIYNGASNDKGSLRMGCLMCPVVSLNTLKNNPHTRQVDLELRVNLDRLKKARRLNNPRTKKQGSILVDDRISIWRDIRPLIVSENLISPDEINEIDQLLANRNYPPTYKKEWIEEQEKLILSNPLTL